MPQGDELTQKQARFVDEYLIDLNATQAAIRAGYSERTSESQGSRLLSNVKVADAIAVRQEARLERVEIDQDRVLLEIARLAFSDMADYVQIDDGGQVYLDFTKLKGKPMPAVQEIYQETENRKVGQDETIPVLKTKFKLYGKETALKMLQAHLGMRGGEGKPSSMSMGVEMPDGTRVAAKVDFSNFSYEELEALEEIAKRHTPVEVEEDDVNLDSK